MVWRSNYMKFTWVIIEDFIFHIIPEWIKFGKMQLEKNNLRLLFLQMSVLRMIHTLLWQPFHCGSTKYQTFFCNRTRRWHDLIWIFFLSILVFKIYGIYYYFSIYYFYEADIYFASELYVEVKEIYVLFQ